MLDQKKGNAAALSLVINLALAISTILLMGYLLAPLFGGVFLPEALLKYTAACIFWLSYKKELNSVNPSAVGSFWEFNLIQSVCVLVFFQNLLGIILAPLLVLLKFNNHKNSQ